MISGNIITDFSLLILFLPLVAFIINIIFGKRLPRQGDWVSVGAILITLILSLSLLMNMLMNWDPNFFHETKCSSIDIMSENKFISSLKHLANR